MVYTWAGLPSLLAVGRSSRFSELGDSVLVSELSSYLSQPETSLSPSVTNLLCVKNIGESQVRKGERFECSHQNVVSICSFLFSSSVICRLEHPVELRYTVRNPILYSTVDYRGFGANFRS